MRVQIEGQRLRWRVSEDECAQLLSGASVLDVTGLGPQQLRRELQLQPTGVGLAVRDHTWSLTLPHADVAALATRLPSRVGLRYTVGEVEIEFDVDVRGARAR